MKTGIDFESDEVYISLVTNGIVTTAKMSTQAARALADALIANAQSLEQSVDDGKSKKKREVLTPPAPGHSRET